MTLQIAFALYPLCLAGVALVWALRTQPGKISRWLVEVAASGSIAAFAFIAGPWAFTSYYLRFALLVLFALAVYYSYRRMNLGSTMGKGQTTGRLALSVAVLSLFAPLNGSAVVAHLRSQESLDLSFPLAAGTYYVLQGGNSAVTNPFHALSGSKLALDIVRLNSFGNRAKGVTPRTLNDYEIFGDRIYSPCAGTVLAVRDDLPDHAPGKADTEHPEGNFIVVKYAESEILIAHLMQRSAAVTTGEKVRLGQLLGRVGNSGNTLEPHLHIDARKNGAETGLLFDGRGLTMNNVVKRAK